MDTYAAHIDFDSVDDYSYDMEIDTDFATDGAYEDDASLKALKRDLRRCAIEDAVDYDDFDDMDFDDI